MWVFVLIFGLFRNFTFILFVHDENFFFYNTNPLGPPINYHTFQGRFEKNHYQELTLIKHKKLNLKRQPCEDNPTFNFNSCIKENLSKQVLYKSTRQHYRMLWISLDLGGFYLITLMSLNQTGLIGFG